MEPFGRSKGRAHEVRCRAGNSAGGISRKRRAGSNCKRREARKFKMNETRKVIGLVVLLVIALVAVIILLGIIFSKPAG
jgi:hypothetical protein